MKKLSRSLIALFVAVIMLSSLFTSVFTSSAATLVYSQSSNSGTRDDICTTLEGTTAASYYTGSYSYDALVSQPATTLLNSLRTLMRSTHKKTTSYNDCRDMATKTDCENENGKITMLYSSYQATYSQYQSGNGWNREHVWPKSLGGNNTSGGGADLHHIRPDENQTNSNRGNKKFGNVSGGSTSKGNLSGEIGGTYAGNYFEPNDNVKGDVARICLYVYVRWYTNWGADSITEVFESIQVLLDWHKQDPVDTWEMGRNEVVAAIQGNRNVFIDYPEFAYLIFGESVPSDLITPSGNKAPAVTTKPATTTANPTVTTKPATTTAKPAVTTKPTVTTTAPTTTEKPVTPETPAGIPLTSGAISLYPKLVNGADTDSLALIYVAERDLIEGYTKAEQKKLTLTVIFYMGGAPNSYHYTLSEGTGELPLSESVTCFGTTYAASEGCLLFAKTFENLPKGGITRADAILRDENGITLSIFTINFS